MEKPLPDIPSATTNTKHTLPSLSRARLTIDARKHLHEFILHLLAGSYEIISAESSERWASHIEGALDGLGERIFVDGWLPGLRRMKRRAVVAEDRRRLESSRTHQSETVSSTSQLGTKNSRSPAKEATASSSKVTSVLSNHLEATRSPQDCLETLKTLAAHSAISAPKPSLKHLLLSLAPYNNTNVDVLNAQCAFLAGVFTFPEAVDGTLDGRNGEIMYGLDSFGHIDIDNDYPIQLVGGTFSLVGTSAAQFPILAKVLRLAVFVYLSAILEVSMLSDSHAPLRYPKPPLSPTAGLGPAGNPVARALSTSHVDSKSNAKRESGFWAFFSKKKDDLLQRAVPSVARRGSLELPTTWKSANESPSSFVPRISQDRPGGLNESQPRSRRFSFITEFRPTFLQQHTRNDPPQSENTDAQEPSRPASLALSTVERTKRFLSTSPNMAIPPPKLLVDLQAREKSNATFRLGGDERAALSSLLGWDSRRLRAGDAALGMTDLGGFVRQQSLSVLYSEYITLPALSAMPTSAGASSSSGEIVATLPALCGKRRRWKTFRFYTPPDECLGDTILRMCMHADDPCEIFDCPCKRRDHEIRLTHSGIRVTIILEGEAIADPSEEELPEMWECCRLCGQETTRKRMHDATYLLSFAKYLELLIYSPALCTTSPKLCEHTALPPRPWQRFDTPLPTTRMNIIRRFSWAGCVVSISLSIVEDVYEVRIPRLQVQRPKGEEKRDDLSVAPPDNATLQLQQYAEDDKRKLRREIMQFWQVLSEQMDTLEGNFISDHEQESYFKRLPRLPSADEPYIDTDEEVTTPKGPNSSLPPPNTPYTPQGRKSVEYPFPSKQGQNDTADTDTPVHATSPMASETSSPYSASLKLLTNMRHNFQRSEQQLYAELARTPFSNLNDVRRSFVAAARGAAKRLSAWEAKHASGPPTVPDKILYSEPEWWKAGCHAVPGGNIIVRENDWGSIIAFTLSSLDYQKELTNMTTGRLNAASAVTVPPSSPRLSSSLPRPSFLSRNASSQWFKPSQHSPDPDQEDAVWHEPESYSAVITRKEHPRDAASLLTLGISEVLRQKNQVESTGMATPSRFMPGGTPSRGSALNAPRSAWAKPDVQVSKQAADGQLSTSSGAGIDKVLQELEAVAEPPRSVRSSLSDHSQLTSSGIVETHIHRGKTSSVVSGDSDATTVPEPSASSHLTDPPPPPPKDPSISKLAFSPSRETTSERKEESMGESTNTASMTSAFTSTLSSALRYVMKSGEPPPVPPKHHHGLLFTDLPAIDDRPHIKYDWTIGKRLKFSCTVYYAKQFDSLRKRCGIEDVFLHSLSRSENWTAEGGKSRSNFWKTTDDQFIIKTLVNAWNVADLHVLIELGPSYFRHMDATVNKPTALAKLLGFYTVEIRNLETGTTQAKADLLVMENLFYRQNVVKTFDLKGIQGRKVKPASNPATSRILFDGDWIEGQQKALTLVQPYSKVVLQEAIKNDSEFLARSNIMDYSLLVGIDDRSKRIACGLVDTIGSYTFAKTLEYKAKHNLASGKEVTVIPPQEYQERFVNALDHYFVACPDKWSRPLDDTKVPGDYRLLPSVL